MKKKMILWLLAVFYVLITAQPAAADGIVIIDPPIPEKPPYLNVKYHHVTVTIQDQVAVTHVDQVFVNPHPFQVEGTYVFPVPEGAVISDFAMWVDGQKLSGEMLPADRARQIYEDIVRRQRDPALLEYIGRNTFRARIFPIPAGAEKRVEIEYTQVLNLDNGLVHYVYPLNTERFSPQPIPKVSVHVEIHSHEAIKAVYSPSHAVGVERRGDYNASVGYEDSDIHPDADFELYYTVAQEDIGLNLLSYMGDEGGFFLMLLAPQVQVDTTQVVARDVVLVLDTSGSMRGDKLAQAKKALAFVLDHLNPEDRFNLVEFSTGVRHFSTRLVGVGERDAARRWVNGLEAQGGTDINRAMLEALPYADSTRPTVIIFLTDGLPTEGVVEVDKILSNIDRAITAGVRIFAFGVGDDVNTLLLDRMSGDHRGASAYVRPGQSIDEQVSALYAKISTPLLSDIQVDFGGIQVQDTFPYPLPDLFAGTQIVMAGRYRQGGPATVTLRGTVNGREQVFKFEDVGFRTSGGESFIPRLWAMRKVGYLLNQIRLHGESPELVQEVVNLAVRYGIMTPYTSFLVQEDKQVFSERGRQQEAERQYAVQATAAPAAPSGKAAVDESQAQRGLQESNTATGATGQVVKVVGNKTFLLREGVWIDTTFDADRMTPLRVGFMSDEYLALIQNRPDWAVYFAVSAQVLVVLPGPDGQTPTAYQVVQGQGDPIQVPAPAATATWTPLPPTGLPVTPSPTVSPTAQTATSPAQPVVCAGVAVWVALMAVWLFVRRK